MAEKKCSSIGGQAVIEGVMMRGKGSMATAVRDPSGKIVVESARFKPFAERSVFFRLPIIRGVLNFVISMVDGIKTLNRSSEVYVGIEDEAPTKAEKWLAKKLNIDIMNVALGISLIIGILLAVVLFIFLPHLAAEGIIKLTGGLHPILVNLIAGGVRIIIFVTYLLLVSLMKDIKRLFRYHGAEHKVIACYEHGLDMTVENAQKMSTIHDRCGTTFLFIVMVFSIFFFSFDVFSQNLWQRVLVRIVFVPLVAGISYEFLKLFAKYDNAFVRIMKAPGLLLQKLTTQPPDDSMVEVALKAFLTVDELERNPDYPTEKFVTYLTVEKAVKELSDYLEKSEAELILMHLAGAKTKTELYDGRRITSEQRDEAKELAKRRLAGEPAQYILNTACFYGYDFYTDRNVLIPRFDTEHLAEKAIEETKKLDSPFVLDLMTGSGAIACVIKLNCPNATVYATDISEDALNVARKNAETLGADINFVLGSLFEPLGELKFDIICSNPPYIPTKDIEKLDGEVKDFEPMLALDGGEDGLKLYREIALNAKNHLNEGGLVILELGIGQLDSVKELFAADFEVESVKKDYNNPPVDRVLTLRLKK